jgi:hypothetical protein
MVPANVVPANVVPANETFYMVDSLPEWTYYNHGAFVKASSHAVFHNEVSITSRVA